jgi:adenylate cyclase
VHRRWVEHELGQRAVTAAEELAGDSALPGAVEVTFLFCDLKDFTAYAEANGDARAIEAVDRFFEVIAAERGEAGELVKSLGDGALLVYRDPCEAVAAGARIIAAMREAGPPHVHAGVHTGVAVARAGDYLGSAVNLAARLLAVSGENELIATDAVVEACGACGWEPAGEASLRGVLSPVRVHRLADP